MPSKQTPKKRKRNDKEQNVTPDPEQTTGSKTTTAEHDGDVVMNTAPKPVSHHIKYLDSIAAISLRKDVNENQEFFFNRGKAIVKLRTNPPFYLNDALNKDDQGQGKYKFNSANTDPQYIRSDGNTFWSRFGPTNTRARATVVSKARFGDAQLKGGGAANLGLYPNTLTAIIQGKSKGDARGSSSKSGGGGKLYDLQLNYKNNILKEIIGDLGGEKGVKAGLTVKVGAYNDYPCLLVHNQLHSVLPGMLASQKIPLNI